MKILIAGATGLIGRELVSQCVARQIAVHFLTTRTNQLNAIDGATGFLWNPKKGEIDDACLSGVTAIVNLAGATVSKRWTASYKEQIRSSRQEPAELLYATLDRSEHSVEHYVSASGISWYPSSDEERYSEVFEPASPSFLGQVTRIWEEGAHKFESLGLIVSAVRTGLVLDKEQGALPKLVSPVRMGAGASLGNGKQWQSWIHIQDIAGIYLHILDKRLPGVFNGVGPNPVTNKEMTKAIADVLHKPMWLPPVPAWFLRTILGEMAELVLEGQWVSAEKIQQSGYEFAYPELNDALTNLLKES